MCDTIVALPSFTADGTMILGKNSDREANEAMCLEYHPPRSYEAGEKVRCTYLEIPQAGRTFGVVLCRPFWMWGAEMGANEKGVAVGNEAVWTRMPLSRSGGLTGMDLVRLALERSATAAQALETITALLAEHGQGGPCGYEDKKFLYHNSFIIADPAEAFILETAGPLWAAVKVRDFYTASNGLTIGGEYDLGHPELVETARRRGWLKRGADFNFAGLYSDRFFSFFSAGRPRRRRSAELMEKERGRLDPAGVFRILRDHGEEDYRPDSHLLLNRLCAHAANDLTRKAGQTTGSLVAHLRPEGAVLWVTGTSAPCLSVYKPVWFEDRVLPDLGPAPGGRFDPASLWWGHEALHRSVLLDYQDRRRVFQADRDRLENTFLAQAAAAGPGGRFSVTQAAFERSRQAAAEWQEKVLGRSVQRRPGPIYRLFWRNQNRKAGLAVR
ncbi:MAG: C69 family dipeptidase [Thermodesulfobacteriota bacterium]